MLHCQMELKNIIIIVVLIWMQMIFHCVNSATKFERGWLRNIPSAGHDENVPNDLQSVFKVFEQARNTVINNEQDLSFGSGIKLNANEQMANEIIMNLKNEELEIGMQNPYMFSPARHIFEVLDTIQESKLFQIIQKMPKGGILHVHEMAMCSTDYLVSLTYLPDLWQRTSNTTANDCIKEFRFARTQPASADLLELAESEGNEGGSIWRLVRDVRAEIGADVYDARVHNLFTLYRKNSNPMTQFRDINDVWDSFLDVFAMVKPIIMYLPVRRAYIHQALREMYEDGVQYVEIRSSLVKVITVYYLSIF